MDTQLKKYLEVFSKYMETKGCKVAEWSGDYYKMNLYDNNPVCISGNMNSRLKNPLDLLPLLEKYLDENKKYFDYEGEDPYSIEIEFDREDMTLRVFETFSEYGSEETSGLSEDAEDNEQAKEIIEYFCKELEMCRGEIRFDFSGGGDSGYIDSTGTSDFFGSVEMPSPFEDFFYGMLSNFSGWEINEGSSGTFIIDMDLEVIELHFSWNTEEQVRHKIYEEKI